jgi:hypothetical protein
MRLGFITTLHAHSIRYTRFHHLFNTTSLYDLFCCIFLQWCKTQSVTEVIKALKGILHNEFIWSFIALCLPEILNSLPPKIAWVDHCPAVLFTGLWTSGDNRHSLMVSAWSTPLDDAMLLLFQHAIMLLVTTTMLCHRCHLNHRLPWPDNPIIRLSHNYKLWQWSS